MINSPYPVKQIFLFSCEIVMEKRKQTNHSTCSWCLRIQKSLWNYSIAGKFLGEDVDGKLFSHLRYVSEFKGDTMILTELLILSKCHYSFLHFNGAVNSVLAMNFVQFIPQYMLHTTDEGSRF